MINPQTISLDFASLEFYDNYVIATINEGVVFDKHHFNIFNDLFEEQYPNQKYGYISMRKYDYTVNPTCYINANEFPNLIGMAVCCFSQLSHDIANFEKSFYKKPMEAFFSQEACVAWLEQLITKERI